MAIGAHDVGEEPALFEAAKCVSGKHTVRGDRGGRACAHVEVGLCRAYQRSTSADHVVVDDNLPPANLCIQSGHTGRPVVQPLLEDERTLHPEVVGERFNPLRTPGVCGAKNKIVPTHPSDLVEHQSLRVEVDRTNLS